MWQSNPKKHNSYWDITVDLLDYVGLYNKPTISNIQDWFNDNTRYEIFKYESGSDALLIVGGTQSEWEQIIQLDLFRYFDIMPQLL